MIWIRMQILIFNLEAIDNGFVRFLDANRYKIGRNVDRHYRVPVPTYKRIRILEFFWKLIQIQFLKI